MRRRATKQQIALTIGLLIILVAAGYWWAPHIWWAFLISRSRAKISSVPVSTLAPAGQTTGWFTCRMGPLSFKLPPEMAEDAERSVAKNKTMISMKAPTVELLILVPVRVPANAQTPVMEIAAHLNCTPMEVIAEGFRTSTDDFRWTMSRAELRRHQTLLNLGFMYPHTPGTKVEMLLDGPLDGVLMIHDGKSAVFEWHVKSGATGGGIVGFTSTAGDLNLDHVRDICASVRCDESKLGQPRTKEELEELVDAIEITRN